MLISISHSFVNIFAGGRSEIKTALFFVYLLALSLIFWWSRKKTFTPWRWKWFGFNLLAMYLYGFGLYLFFTLTNRLSLTAVSIAGRNGEISSSILWHTHIAKAVVGQVFAFFGKVQFATLDAGGAYLGLVPAWVFLIGTVLLVTLIFQAVLYFIASFPALLVKKNNRQKIFLLVGYAIVSFSLVKTSIDGGLFNPSFGLGAVFIWLFILREKKKPISAYIYAAASLGIILVAISLYFNPQVSASGLSLSLLATQLLLYTALLYGSSEQINPQFLLALAVLLAASWFVSGARDREIYDYSQTPLAPGTEIYFYNYHDHNVEALTVSAGQSVGQLARQLGKNISYLPLAVPGQTCMDKAPDAKFTATLISSEPLAVNSFPPTSDLTIKNNNSVKDGKNWRTPMTFFINPCLPEILSVVNGELLKNHLLAYILVNPVFNDQAYPE